MATVVGVTDAFVGDGGGVAVGTSAVGVAVRAMVGVLVGGANDAVGLAGTGVGGISEGVGVAAAISVGEANGAVGLIVTPVRVGGTGVGGISVGLAMAVAVAVIVAPTVALIAIVGVVEVLTVGESVGRATGSGVDVAASGPVHPASMMTARSPRRRVSR